MKRRLFCNDPCKKRGWRRQRAGLAENAYRDGALRGPVPLGEETKRERAVSLLLAPR